MKGLVASIKYSNAQSEQLYCVVDTATAKIGYYRSEIVLKEGETIDFDGEGGTVKSAAISFDDAAVSVAREAAAEAARRCVSNKPYAIGVKALDEVTARMWDRLSASAALLLKKLMLGAPVIIRFHNDADGSTGAFGLYKSLADLESRIGFRFGNTVWKMQRSVFYGIDDASSDVLMANNYGTIEKPLLLCTDFGTALESNDGVATLGDKFDVIWLDHHPIIEGFRGLDFAHYTNPWRFGGDSNYTAGFLSCAFAKTFSEVDTRELEEASFIGDYSEYSAPTEESRRLSMLLDLMTSDTRVVTGSASSNLTPETIDTVLKDKARADELLGYAKNKLSEAIDSALGAVKMYQAGGAKIFVADFENVRGDESARYPLPGRFASKLLDKMRELNTEPCIVVLHFGKLVSVRVDKSISDKADLLGVMSEMKKAYAGIESGGGHMSAGTLKVADAHDRSQIMRLLVDGLKGNLES